jgi:hypothetical protein
MGQFGEFDIPDDMARTNQPKKDAQTPQKPVEKVEEAKARDTKPSASTRPQRSVAPSFKWLSKAINALVVLGGGFYVYNWFIVEGKTMDDPASMVVLIGGVIVAFSLLNFVGSLIGKATGFIFNAIRTIVGLGLLGFFVYSLLQMLEIL